MKNTKIFDSVKNCFRKVRFGLEKHSPEILIAAGAVGVVTSAVLACKATLKVNDILAETATQLDNIHACIGNDAYAKKYTEEDAQKDTAIVYIQTGVKLFKLYAPAVMLGALSIAGIAASNNILRKRCAAVSAAYAAVDMSFKEYRKRVSERFGDEIERQIRYNIKEVISEETETDENGNETTVSKTIETADIQHSCYAKFFDECSPYWEKDSEYNLTFLNAQQRYANDLLKANGRLFLNEVYEMLGLPKTKAGQIVGWVYDKNNPVGDNYVDFGIYDTNRSTARDFVNGYERSILLDFNVDGNIWELMT